MILTSCLYLFHPKLFHLSLSKRSGQYYFDCMCHPNPTLILMFNPIKITMLVLEALRVSTLNGVKG